ncbi:hypothetical protein NE237_028036 [Protea cynaroides]|uniref:Uncharacterized protein n=1 Tax=Protea cynaroides TaxID=273540 RepID=A0A9Q0GT07_9MAGN|nr:hypothetical protein NE237_028036 [Protea cynaroides]
MLQGVGLQNPESRFLPINSSQYRGRFLGFPALVSGVANNGNPKISSTPDLGRFLSFPPFGSTGMAEHGNNSCPQPREGQHVNNGGFRKKHWWSIKDKGKRPMTGASLDVHGGQIPIDNGTVPNSRMGKKFAQVAGGMPDLSNLPDPIVSRGITRVVLPQDVVDRQMVKYQSALIGRAEECTSVLCKNDGKTAHVSVDVAELHGNRRNEVDYVFSEVGKFIGELKRMLVVDRVPVELRGRPEEDALGMSEAVARGVDEVAAVLGEKSQQGLVNPTLMDEDQNPIIPIRTVVASPGGSAALVNHGRVEVLFEDVSVVDDAMREKGGEFTKVGK